MSTSDLQVENRPEHTTTAFSGTKTERFGLTLVEPPSLFVSAYRQLHYWLFEPKVTVPAEYYRGAVKLPATDLRPWFYDLPSQLKVAFEKPRDPIGIYNHSQQEKRALCAMAFALALGAGGWFWRHETGLLLGIIAGFVTGELAGT